jgi:hypothetical protein
MLRKRMRSKHSKKAKYKKGLSLNQKNEFGFKCTKRGFLDIENQS